ncbi:tumor suppressing sub-chromosomal transferable candidate [Trema orientale]|uniref:U5 small nuclear ribonucleoprotein TSSC4 n=1 Tax=Trema orientale TaxID=63057 RepID=A0A2P5BNZ2_TREOI|nr:tumor suppressing sub-chromosomal transferable candidate [Trema orientale]
MEDSFKVRVNKIFGSLNSSSSLSATSPSSLSSVWSLTDDEIERREWNRDKPTPQPQPQPQSTLQPDALALEKDLQDLDDDDDLDLQGPGSPTLPAKPDDYNDEEWHVKSSIGLDPTLDYEEEEDEFDKVAVGKDEKPEDGVYLKEIGDYGIHMDSANELPTCFNQVTKDPRANHLAAKLRLKEDAEAAQNIPSLRVSDQQTASPLEEEEMEEQEEEEEDVNVPSNPKSILKRKDNQLLDSKSHKRVRFDPQCKDNGHPDTHHHKLVPDAPIFASGVPDYLQNPSRYTRYTFDDSSSEMNEESNKQALMDFWNLLKRSNASTEDQDQDQNASFDPSSRSVTFIPRKKTGDTSAMVDCCTQLVQQVGIGKDVPVRKRMSIGIAAVDAEEEETTDVSAMEEDEPKSVADGRRSSQKPGRRYRMKARSELDG